MFEILKTAHALGRATMRGAEFDHVDSECRLSLYPYSQFSSNTQRGVGFEVLAAVTVKSASIFRVED
jgi:hypothetical protein